MLRPTPPMSNAERQRRFQAAHPGYDRRRKSRSRSSAKRGAAQIRAAMKAAAAVAESQTLAEPRAIPAIPMPLMLPAPIQDPTMAALDALVAGLATTPADATIPAR